MKFIFLRRTVVSFVTAANILALVAMIFSTLANAQVIDTVPPAVRADAITEARKGDSQVFSIVASDNEGVESLEIFYRLGPLADFIRSSMTRVGQTDLYTFTIDAHNIPESVDVIQYYVEAKDKAGNRTLQGFSFSPLERALVDLPFLADEATSQEQEDESESLLGSLSTTQKVVYGTLGLIVAVALVSAADGGGGSDSNNSSSTVPVTVVVEPLIE